MRQLPRIFLITIFLFAVLVDVRAQQSTTQTERERGMEFYNQGDDKEAIKSFKSVTKKNKYDIEIWHYLGLAYARSGKTKDAGKAYDNASKNSIDLFAQQFEETNSERRKQNFIKLKPHFEFALKSAENYLTLNPNTKGKKREEWEERIALLKTFTQYAANDAEISDGVYTSKTVTTRAVITKKIQPDYTEDARREGVQGVIQIKAILGANGKVIVAIPLNGLPNGLTQSAIRAAQRTEFIPAMKDGQPVSQWVTLEYMFRIY